MSINDYVITVRPQRPEPRMPAWLLVLLLAFSAVMFMSAGCKPVDLGTYSCSYHGASGLICTCDSNLLLCDHPGFGSCGACR